MVIKCTDKGKMLAVLSKMELEMDCMWFDGEKPTGCVPDPDTFPIWLLIDEAARMTWAENDFDYSHVKDMLTDYEYLALDSTLSSKNEDAKIVSNDPVNHPSHYTQGKVECINAMIEAFGVEAVKHFCLCNAFKYHWRHDLKAGQEDIEKAVWYMDKYRELMNREG